MRELESPAEVCAELIAALADPSAEAAERRVRAVLEAQAAAPEARSDALHQAARDALRAARLRLEASTEQGRARERFELLSAAASEGILVHVDGTVLVANQRLYELLGCEAADMTRPGAVLSFIAPEDVPGVMQRLRERVEGDFLATGVRKDGTRFSAELSTKQSKLGENPVRIVAVRDVTERERVHAQLRESAASLIELLTSAFDVFVVSHDNVIVEIGGRVEELLGRKPAEIMGRNVFDFLAPSVHTSTRQRLEARRAGAYDSALITADGQPIPVEICGVFTQRGGRVARVSGIRDLRPLRTLEADQQRLQQQLERSQRLESLGVLAGGIAHDFNNLLVAILGNADLLQATLTNDDDRECALAIRGAGERAAELVRQMLAYAGQKNPVQRNPVDLTARMNELSQLLAATLSKKAELELQLEPGCIVLGDSASLSQVLMNLLTNASDALEDQPGRVVLTTRRVNVPDARWEDALGAAIHPGNWVEVAVSDSGCGMDEATRVRVFEPFFSTKPRGHGLGLAACLGIVSSHGGAILVESELGRGTRFSVLLPAADAQRSEAPTTATPQLAKVGRVLIVDDEPVVRAHLRRALTLRGYEVGEADGGEAGVSALTEQRYDVVLLDLTMNDIDGLEVIRRVRASGCDVPIVLSSGYLDADSERALEPHSIQAFLRKPYLTSELVAALDRARALG